MISLLRGHKPATIRRAAALPAPSRDEQQRRLITHVGRFILATGRLTPEQIAQHAMKATGATGFRIPGGD